MVLFVAMLFIPMMIQHIVVDKRYVDFEKKNKWALFTFFVILTVLVSLRHKTVGNDTSNYILYFNHFKSTDWHILNNVGLEMGFSYFTKAVTLLTDDPQVYFAVTAIVTVALIYPTYKRLCVDPSLTIVLFCLMSTFVMMFSGLRQMMAIAIGFVAYEFTRKKKLIPYIIAVAIAIFFHTSAFMLIFMYPLYHAKITKKWLYVVVPALTVFFVFSEEIFVILGVVLERYTEFDASIESTGAYTMLILFALFTVFSFVIPDDSELDSEIIGLRNFLLLSLALQMFAPLNTLAMRMGYYYIIFIPLLIPKIIEHKSEKWSQVAVLARHVMVVFFLAYFFISANGEGNLNVFPYHFFWEKV